METIKKIRRSLIGADDPCRFTGQDSVKCTRDYNTVRRAVLAIAHEESTLLIETQTPEQIARSVRKCKALQKQAQAILVQYPLSKRILELR